MIEIKTVNGVVLHASHSGTLRDAAEEAVKAGANLGGAYLHGADLNGADLCGADLCGAYLHGADLYGANLGGAYLGGANLGGANLGGANLGGADLNGADLCGANLAGIQGNISNSHELLAHIAVRYDSSLCRVAAMIAGRFVGCWRDYTAAIREHFGEETMRKLWLAWSQDESWGVVAEMRAHGWPEPVAERAKQTGAT